MFGASMHGIGNPVNHIIFYYDSYSLPISHMKMFYGAIRPGDLDVSVVYNAPRVEFFPVVHDDCPGFLYHSEHHH